jgi:hypothetical protein
VFAALLAPLLSTLSGSDSISQLKSLGEARDRLAEVGVREGNQPVGLQTFSIIAAGLLFEGFWSQPRMGCFVPTSARAALVFVAVQHRAEALEQAARADSADRQSFLQDVAARRR